MDGCDADRPDPVLHVVQAIFTPLTWQQKVGVTYQMYSQIRYWNHIENGGSVVDKPMHNSALIELRNL